MEVAMALVPKTEIDGARKVGAHDAMGPADLANLPDAVVMNDHQGQTWEEIVGTANVVDKRIAIAAVGSGTEVVSAASFAGMPPTSIPGGPALNAVIVDGTQYPMASYKGILGTVFCAGSDCMVEYVADTDTLTGSWYFTPNEPKDWYVKSTDGEGVTTYMEETYYVRFGHWLIENDVSGVKVTGVNTFATTGIENTGDVTNVNTGEGAATLTDTSASYRGPAAGMSVEKTTNTDGDITEINSAAFTATVNLKATFGERPTLGGTVTDFRGDATDANWSVELQVTPLESDATVTGGRTVATGRDGVWTATPYGVAGERPTGIFGGFNAHFTDGHAAGAYTTR